GNTDVECCAVAERGADRGQSDALREKRQPVETSTHERETRRIAQHTRLLELRLIPPGEKAGDSAVASARHAIVVDREPGCIRDPCVQFSGAEHGRELPNRRYALPEGYHLVQIRAPCGRHASGSIRAHASRPQEWNGERANRREGGKCRRAAAPVPASLHR